MSQEHKVRSRTPGNSRQNFVKSDLIWPIIERNGLFQSYLFLKMGHHQQLSMPKEVVHIFSCEPITEKADNKILGVIGTFWQGMTRELYDTA